MSTNVFVVLLGWLIALAIFFGFIVLLRYLHHRERMALISQGFDPTNRQKRKRKQNRGILRAGLITGMVGLALTLGLYPVGFFLPTTFSSAPFHLGPWLLPGLIPLGVGLALTASYYLEQSNLSADEETNEQEKENIVHLKRQKQQ
jgi:formate hydrogenlyase subunit 3/multisubunit Na+/H+ antiporter MnhD subunit